MINKKVVMIVGIVLLAAGATYAAGVVFFGGNAHGDISDGLVLDLDLTQDNYVTGTKTFADDSGEGNNGVSNNSATFTTDKYGKSTGAMVFNANGYVDTGTKFPSITSVITISVWVKPSSTQSNIYNDILGNHQDNFKGFVLQQNAGNVNQYSWVYGNGTAWAGGTGLFNLSSTQWQHVVIVKNSQNCSVYIDGFEQVALRGTTCSSDISPATTINFRMGVGYPTGSRLFNGSISEVKVWNRALSAAEISTLYNSSKPKMTASSSSSGLVGHWALDSEGYNSATNIVTDKTPYSNHGTNSGATLTTDRMGHSNGSMRFYGNSNINIGDNLDMGTSDFTLAAWIKTTAVSEYKGIIVKGASGSLGYGMLLSATGLPDFSIQSSVNTHIFATTEVDDNNWHHIAMSADRNGNVSIYIDGNLNKVENISSQSGSINTASFLRIGSFSDAAQWFFNGSIADVRIYNRALSAEEVLALNNSYNPKFASGSLQKGLILDMPLTSRWTKEGAAGSELMTDRTPYSNDGQNNGATVGSSYTSFDGNDYIDLPNSIGYTSKFSAFAWFKHLGNPPGDYHIVFGGREFEISITPLGEIRTGVYTTSRYVSNHGSGLKDGNWHLVGFTFNGTSKRSYIDGNYVGGMDVSGTLTSSFSNRRMGRYGSDPTYSLNGSIADVKIYNRALSDSEVKLLYARGRQ